MEKIYYEYSKLVFNYLYSLCKNYDIAEELTQDVFYKAIRSINKFNNNCKISTWLIQIAKNTWFDYLRKEKKRKNLFTDDNENFEKLLAEQFFYDNIDDKLEIINLYKHIHMLDSETREVFYLRLKGELSFKDIGLILNKTENWARLVFYRGKIKLKEDIKNDKK